VTLQPVRDGEFATAMKTLREAPTVPSLLKRVFQQSQISALSKGNPKNLQVAKKFSAAFFLRVNQSKVKPTSAKNFSL